MAAEPQQDTGTDSRAYLSSSQLVKRVYISELDFLYACAGTLIVHALYQNLYTYKKCTIYIKKQFLIMNFDIGKQCLDL